jgi:hypothetical protein
MARKTRTKRSNTLKNVAKAFLLESRMEKVRKYLYEGAAVRNAEHWRAKMRMDKGLR